MDSRKFGTAPSMRRVSTHNLFQIISYQEVVMTKYIPPHLKLAGVAKNRAPCRTLAELSAEIVQPRQLLINHEDELQEVIKFFTECVFNRSYDITDVDNWHRDAAKFVDPKAHLENNWKNRFNIFVEIGNRSMDRFNDDDDFLRYFVSDPQEDDSRDSIRFQSGPVTERFARFLGDSLPRDEYGNPLEVSIIRAHFMSRFTRRPRSYRNFMVSYRDAKGHRLKQLNVHFLAASEARADDASVDLIARGRQLIGGNR
jgi:hypothetical protein